MCGLCGAVIGNKAKRRMAEINALVDTFTRLLLLSEHRGPHATGVAWVKRDGTMQVAKEPLPAHQFVQTGTYLDWLCGVNRQVTYLMGHTRWPSRGSVRNHEENHPLSCAPPILLTHNGTITDHARHFRRLGLPRTTQVDSELLARLTQYHTGKDGIGIEDFLAGLAPLEGSMSAALVATSHPEQIVLVKGNMPLDVRLHRRQRIWLYTSESRILDAALGEDAGWEKVSMTPGDALVINTASIHTPRHLRFTFQGMARLAAWHRFTGA